MLGEATSFTTSAPDGSQVTMRNVTDRQKNTKLILDMSARTILTFHHLPGKLVTTLSPHQSCSSEALSAPRSVVLGHAVSEFTESLPGLTSQVKVALDLDCYPLFMVESFSSGAFNEREVTSVLNAEPPDSLFEAPANYRELSPSQADEEYRGRYPGHSLWNQDFLVTMNRRYFSNRP